MTQSHPGPDRADSPDWTATERALATIWRRLLSVPRINREDNFFASSGDSFRANQLAVQVSRTFGIEVPPTLAFDRPVLAGQAAWVDAQPVTGETSPFGEPTVAATATGTATALATQQVEFLDWMFATDPPRDPGTICCAIRIREPFDADLLRQAFDILTERHEPLRTVCLPSGDGRGLVVSTADRLPVEVAEVAPPGETAAERAHHAVDLAVEERNRPSDLVRDPLVRALVIRIADDDCVLVLSVHHFVFDGWSLGALLRELGLVYSSLRSGHGNPLRPLALDYSAYCDWTAHQWDRNRPYWQQVLAGAPRALVPFPGRRATHKFSRRRHSFSIPANRWEHVRAVAIEHNSTAFMAAAACWTAVLSQWTGTTDIVLMSPVPGRVTPEHDALIGCLVQVLLIRVDATGAADFPTLFARVRAAAMGASANQFHAYHETSRKVPYPARIHYESWGGELFFPGLRSEQFSLPREQESLDWPSLPDEPDLSTPELIVEEQPDGSVSAAVVYNHHAYDHDVAAQLAEAFLAQVDALARRA